MLKPFKDWSGCRTKGVKTNLSLGKASSPSQKMSSLKRKHDAVEDNLDCGESADGVDNKTNGFFDVYGPEVTTSFYLKASSSSYDFDLIGFILY